MKFCVFPRGGWLRLPAFTVVCTCLCTLLFASPAHAQTAPTSRTEDEETAVKLSPFVVSTEQDDGYAATNTLAGTRLKSAIANTPVSLSVLTRAFLNDIAAIDSNRAMEYALNASNDTTDATGNAQAWGAFSYRVRGFANGTNARNYFRSDFLGEGYNVDYLELARGPNSVLFGIASPGGTYNATIKRALLGQNVTSLQLRAGSFDEYRASVDVGRTLGKKKTLSVRLNLLEHDANGFYDFEEIERRAATLTATWRPFRDTTIRLEAERARFHDERARPFPIGDRLSDWIRAGRVLHTDPASRPANTTATFSSASGNGIFFFPQSTIGPRPVTFSGNYFRTSTSAQIRGGLATDAPSIFDRAIAPRTANMLGRAGGNTSDQDVLGVFVEQRVGRNLFVEAAYYFQGRDYLFRVPEAFNDNELYIEVSANNPVFDASTGAQTGYQANPGVGKYLTRSTYAEQELYQRQDNWRLTTSYELNLGRLGRHQIAGLLQRTVARGDTVQRREANVAADRQFANLTDSRNGIIRISRIDFSSSDLTFHGIQDPAQNPVSGRLLGTPSVGVQSGMVNVGWSGAKNTIDSAIAATQSSFFAERLWFTGGIRRDHVRNNSASAVRDPVTTEYRGLAYNRPDDLNVSDTTASVGLAFHVQPWLTVYTNQSDNFNTQGNAILFGETGATGIAGNTKGQGRDLGIRSKLFGGRVNLNLGYYKTSQVDQYYFIVGTYAGAVNSIWSALGQSTRPLLTGNDVQEVSGQGLEFELTANPTKNFRLTFNYARTNKYGQTRLYRSLLGYLEANEALWLAPGNASRPASGGLGATVQDVWNTIRQLYTTDTLTNGREPFAFRPESANAFARYDFRQGLLKGFAVGGGVNWRGPMVLAYRSNDSRQPVHGYEQIFVNGLLSYEKRLTAKLTATFQLNVDNLLNFDDAYPRRVYWFDDARGPSMTYQYPYQVRRWSLSSTLRL